jgi:hypothetical protein
LRLHQLPCSPIDNEDKKIKQEIMSKNPTALNKS